MTYMRRICSWCPKPHQFGAKCKCGAEVFSYGYKTDFWCCFRCGDFFKLPENAPETHGMCHRAEAEWKLKNLPKRTAMHGFITAAPSAIFVWGAAAFGLGWWTGNDYAISFGLFVLGFFAVVAVFWGIGKGKAYCSCGQLSPVLECTAARKRWHKEHKQAIREHMSAESEVL